MTLYNFQIFIQGVVAHGFNPSTEEAGLCEFRFSLVYNVRCPRLARTI